MRRNIEVEPDSCMVYPERKLSDILIRYTDLILDAQHTVWIMNIQYTSTVKCI